MGVGDGVLNCFWLGFENLLGSSVGRATMYSVYVSSPALVML